MGIADARPVNFQQIVGLKHNIERVQYDVKGAIQLGEPLRSYVVVGPSGTGKTTIATVIVTETGGVVHKFLGSDIKKPEDLYEISARLNNGDVVIIEEAHTINKMVQAVLLEWIENFKILGGAEFNIFDAPRVCFVFPTTNAGKLSKALRDRCITLTTHYYSVDEIKQILLGAASRINLDLSQDEPALTLLAQSSRGTPRIAVMHRLDFLRKIMVVDKLPFNLETVQRMLAINHINAWGLEKNDIEYCKILHKKILENKNRPISKNILIQSTGYAIDIIENIIEAYLHQIGVIKIEPRGRMLTDFGCEILGLDQILHNPWDELVQYQIDENVLKELINDVNVRKGGMKALAPKLGLRYGTDNHIMLNALRNIGYTARKSAGIVPIDG